MEADNDWLFVVELLGLRGSILVFTKMSLLNFMADTLEAYHDSANIDIMW